MQKKTGEAETNNFSQLFLLPSFLRSFTKRFVNSFIFIGETAHGTKAQTNCLTSKTEVYQTSTRYVGRQLDDLVQ